MLAKVSRRDFLKLVGSAAGVAALAACAPKVVKETVVVESTKVIEKEVTRVVEKAAEQKVKIRITGWGGPIEVKGLTGLADAYVQQHPNLEIEWIFPAGGIGVREKVLAMIAGGDAPDALMLNTGQFEGFAARGALRALDAFVAADGMDLSIYWPQAIEGSKYRGTLYGLPRDLSNQVIYYNKTLFDAAGVPYPKDDWNWNDFVDTAKKLTISKDGKTEQWGYGLDNGLGAWICYVWANDGQILDADKKKCLLLEPKAVEGVEFYYSLDLTHHVAPPPGALPEMGWSGGYFMNQKVAMCQLGPWWRPQLVNDLAKEKQFPWDIAFIPKSPNTGKNATHLWTDQFAVFSSTPHPQECWGHIKYLTSKEGLAALVKLMGPRSVSPIKELCYTDEWKNYGGCRGQIYLDSMAFAFPPPTNFGNGSQLEILSAQELSLVLTGQATVKEALAKICQQIDPILAMGD